MAPAMKIVLGLLTFVTVGMIIGALINRLEDSYGSGFPSLRGLRGQKARVSTRDSMDSQIRGAYMGDVNFCPERNGLLLNG